MATSARMRERRRASARSCPPDGISRTERMSPVKAGGSEGPPSSEVGPASTSFVATKRSLYSGAVDHRGYDSASKGTRVAGIAPAAEHEQRRVQRDAALRVEQVVVVEVR